MSRIADYLPHFAEPANYVSLLDQSGPAACPRKTGDGQYTCALTPNAAGQRLLRFRATDDRCAGRKAVLTAKPLLKIK